MRTFEEAMMLGRVAYGDVKAQLESGERMERYQCLADEVSHHPLTAEMLLAVMVGIQSRMPEGSNDHDCLFSVLVSIFLNGVMIGIEMEKAE